MCGDAVVVGSWTSRAAAANRMLHAALMELMWAVLYRRAKFRNIEIVNFDGQTIR